MKIKSITLHGFKSFADRTKVDFHDGITAVVGPNGCGKSNISDALRWVLGEQRPTAIRGSRMDEAIFGGTEGRKPIHRAEVALRLSNEDGLLPVPYPEVEVGRTVYRGGESEYLLNGGGCRLRDVQDMCRDTGLGANAYAIIEGRMIDSILSDRAEERRALFEEAAEIGRYKDRRRTALRRLEQAEGDLRRLDDLLAEVKSKVRSLAQQRGRAERHGKLRARLLELEVATVDARLTLGRRRLEGGEAELEKLRQRQPNEEARLQTAETEKETLRIQHAELERGRSEAARELEDVRQRLEALERERLVAAERVGAARERINAIDEELRWTDGRRSELASGVERSRDAVAGESEMLDGLKGDEESLSAEVSELRATRDTELSREEEARRQLDAVVGEIGSLEADVRATGERAAERADETEHRRELLRELEKAEEELRASLERLSADEGRAFETERLETKAVAATVAETERTQEEARTARERVAGLEGELAAARARLASLDDFFASGAALPPAVGELLQASVSGVLGVLADYVEAPSELAAAVESQLGAYQYGVVVRDWRSVTAVRSWLEARGEDGDMLLLPLDPGPALDGDRTPGGASCLSDHVEPRGDGAPWVRALLGAVRLEEAEGSDRDHAWIRPDGTGVDRWGAVRLGSPGGAKGMLRHRAELESVRQAADRLETELETASEELAEAESALSKAKTRCDEAERRCHEASLARREREAEHRSGADRLAGQERERLELARRLDELQASRETAEARVEDHTARLEALRERSLQAEEQLATAHRNAAKARERWETGRDMLHDVQLQIARHEANLGASTDRLRRAEEALAELEERATKRASERVTQESIIETGEAAAKTGEDELEALFASRGRLEERLREVEESLEAGRRELERRESSLREERRLERQHAERRHQLELEVTELKAAEANLRERLEAEWDAPLEELRQRVETPEDGAVDEWESELEQVRRSLARLGPVNLLAEQEYEEEKERVGFLVEQRDDLVAAAEDLKSSIRRINRSAAEAFTDTFEQIRDHFQRTFRTLFEGGECDLWLEDRSDPLDSPIEISASPRGKRTQRIHLLSGGERALTALALLFAIYLAKPSPFCLMDEVDAPLDETNVQRFVNMLQQFKSETQFIIITHNPRTIEAADWIYGVTMQEPGVSSIVGVELGVTPSQVA